MQLRHSEKRAVCARSIERINPSVSEETAAANDKINRAGGRVEEDNGHHRREQIPATRMTLFRGHVVCSAVVAVDIAQRSKVSARLRNKYPGVKIVIARLDGGLSQPPIESRLVPLIPESQA